MMCDNMAWSISWAVRSVFFKLRSITQTYLTFINQTVCLWDSVCLCIGTCVCKSIAYVQVCVCLEGRVFSDVHFSVCYLLKIKELLDTLYRYYMTECVTLILLTWTTNVPRSDCRIRTFVSSVDHLSMSHTLPQTIYFIKPNQFHSKSKS